LEGCGRLVGGTEGRSGRKVVKLFARKVACLLFCPRSLSCLCWLDGFSCSAELWSLARFRPVPRDQALQTACQPYCKQQSPQPLQGACLASPGCPPPPPPPSPACPYPPSPQPRPPHHHRGQEPPWERGGGEGRTPVTLLPSWPWPLSPGACSLCFSFSFTN